MCTTQTIPNYEMLLLLRFCTNAIVYTVSGVQMWLEFQAAA